MCFYLTLLTLGLLVSFISIVCIRGCIYLVYIDLPGHLCMVQLICVHNPYLQKNINTLENVQKFALRMCSKRWDQAYSQLLQLFDITKLSERRLYLDLCTMFKIVHGLFHFPSGIFNTYSGRTPSTNRPLLFHRLFTHTNYFYNSFVPRTVAIWNTLPLSLVSNSYVPHFRSHVWMHITH